MHTLPYRDPHYEHPVQVDLVLSFLSYTFTAWLQLPLHLLVEIFGKQLQFVEKIFSKQPGAQESDQIALFHTKEDSRKMHEL